MHEWSCPPGLSNYTGYELSGVGRCELSIRSGSCTERTNVVWNETCTDEHCRLDGDGFGRPVHGSTSTCRQLLLLLLGGGADAVGGVRLHRRWCCVTDVRAGGSGRRRLGEANWVARRRDGLAAGSGVCWRWWRWTRQQVRRRRVAASSPRVARLDLVRRQHRHARLWVNNHVDTRSPDDLCSPIDAQTHVGGAFDNRAWPWPLTSWTQGQGMASDCRVLYVYQVWCW